MTHASGPTCCRVSASVILLARPTRAGNADCGFLHRPVDNFFQLRRQIGIQAHGCDRLSIQDSVENDPGSYLREMAKRPWPSRITPRRTKRDPCADPVARLALVPATYKPLCPVLCRACQEFIRSCGGRAETPGPSPPELAWLNRNPESWHAARGDENVCRLDVAVHDSFGVRPHPARPRFQSPTPQFVSRGSGLPEMRCSASRLPEIPWQ